MQTQTLCRVSAATNVQRFSYAKWIYIIVFLFVASRILCYWWFISSIDYTERLVKGKLERTRS
jgi:hypothetical protein